MEKKKKISVQTILLIVAVIIIGVMAFFIYKLSTEKAEEKENAENSNRQVGNLENTVDDLQGKLDAIANIINSNSNNTSDNTVNNTTSNTNKDTVNLNNDTTTNTSSNSISSTNDNVKYKFESGDNLAAQGNPGVVKIYELNDKKMKFEYNQGWNFEKSTIDRTITGTANINSEGLYEYTEETDGHKYKITIDFSEEKINIKEYKDEELISERNLWS